MGKDGQGSWLARYCIGLRRRGGQPPLYIMIDYIFVDVKQPSTFKHQIQKGFDNVTIKNLGDHAGDVLIRLKDGRIILIEIKEVPGDFIASIVDKRLFKQAEGMREITPWSFLLMSGDFSYDSELFVLGIGSNGYGRMGTWNRNAMEGALRAVRARGVGTEIAYRGYLDAINRIVNWVSDADKGAVTTEKIKLSPFDKDDQEMVNLLCWFDGVGVIQAKNFLQWCKANFPNAKRFEIFEMAYSLDFDQYESKPAGWTNNTIKRNGQKMGAITKPKTEWVEELDAA